MAVRTIKIRVNPKKRLQYKFPVRRKSQGVKTGLGVCEFFASIFEAQEETVKAKRVTDDEIKERVLEEYPGRRSMEAMRSGVKTVGYYRTLYNIGRLTGSVPKLRSRQYNEKGDPINPRNGKVIPNDGR